LPVLSSSYKSTWLLRNPQTATIIVTAKKNEQCISGNEMVGHVGFLHDLDRSFIDKKIKLFRKELTRC
jgi:hypothetical protein